MCTYNGGKVFAAKTVMCYDYIKAIKASYSCTQWCKLINHPFWASNMQPFSNHIYF